MSVFGRQRGSKIHGRQLSSWKSVRVVDDYDELTAEQKEERDLPQEGVQIIELDDPTDDWYPTSSEDELDLEDYNEKDEDEKSTASDHLDASDYSGDELDDHYQTEQQRLKSINKIRRRTDVLDPLEDFPTQLRREEAKEQSDYLNLFRLENLRAAAQRTISSNRKHEEHVDRTEQSPADTLIGNKRFIRICYGTFIAMLFDSQLIAEQYDDITGKSRRQNATRFTHSQMLLHPEAPDRFLFWSTALYVAIWNLHVLYVSYGKTIRCLQSPKAYRALQSLWPYLQVYRKNTGASGSEWVLMQLLERFVRSSTHALQWLQDPVARTQFFSLMSLVKFVGHSQFGSRYLFAWPFMQSECVAFRSHSAIVKTLKNTSFAIMKEVPQDAKSMDEFHLDWQMSLRWECVLECLGMMSTVVQVVHYILFDSEVDPDYSTGVRSMQEIHAEWFKNRRIVDLTRPLWLPRIFDGFYGDEQDVIVQMTSPRVFRCVLAPFLRHFISDHDFAACFGDRDVNIMRTIIDAESFLTYTDLFDRLAFLTVLSNAPTKEDHVDPQTGNALQKRFITEFHITAPMNTSLLTIFSHFIRFNNHVTKIRFSAIDGGVDAKSVRAIKMALEKRDDSVVVNTLSLSHNNHWVPRHLDSCLYIVRMTLQILFMRDCDLSAPNKLTSFIEMVNGWRNKKVWGAFSPYIDITQNNFTPKSMEHFMRELKPPDMTSVLKLVIEDDLYDGMDDDAPKKKHFQRESDVVQLNNEFM